MEVEAPRMSRGCDTSNDSCPEFEFWMVDNLPELEQGGQLTADELFVDGVLLPLHLLSFSSSNTEPEPPLSPPTLVPRETETTEVGVETEEEPSSSITSAPITSSKRWKDIFKKSPSPEETKENKSSKKERKGSSGGGGAELNINMWPFSRSRSAGTTGGRPKPSAVSMGKSSSAPCSRSNSRGERKWATSSPGLTGGIHVGRTSPVWQVRRGGAGRAAAEAKAGPRRKAGRAGSGVRGLKLAPLNGCIGYRRQASCRGDEAEAAALGGANGSLFRFRGLFTKKVY